MALPPPAPDWFERPLGEVGDAQFVLDLRAPAPPPVRALAGGPHHGPAASRTHGPGSYMAGGALVEWFDVVVHRQEVTPVLPV